MARDNSEDAVTWNVFSFLEDSGILADVLASISGQDHTVKEVVYWSFSRAHSGVWPELQEAREKFELRPKHGSEPDIILITDKALFLIEAKLTSGNKTSCENVMVLEKYEHAEGSWFHQVFHSSPKEIAVGAQKYELMRFWLLGSWIARRCGLDFYLVNLVRSGAERNIESGFGKHIRLADQMHFQRFTWEEIYAVVAHGHSDLHGRNDMLHYFQNKSLGYSNGKIRTGVQCREAFLTTHSWDQIWFDSTLSTYKCAHNPAFSRVPDRVGLPTKGRSLGSSSWGSEGQATGQMAGRMDKVKQLR